MMYRAEQLAPHSVEAEEAVLGAILINPDALLEVLEFLSPEAFFIVRHAWVYEAMLALYRDKQPIDYLTIVNHLEQSGRLAECGGAAWILSLINKTPSALNCEGYGRIVEHMAIRRQLIEAAGQMARAAHSEETDIDTVLENAHHAIIEVVDNRASSLETVESTQTIAYDVRAEVVAAHDNPRELLGVSTGIPELDGVMLGIEPSLLDYIAGRPGMGKSTLLAQLADGLGQAGHNVLFFSLEMRRIPLTRRMICQRAQIPNTAARQGRLTKSELERFETEMRKTRGVFVEDRGGLTVLEMQSIARKYDNKYGLTAVMVDTINRVRAVGNERGNDRSDQYHRLTRVSHSLADWAHNESYAVIAAAQLSRPPKGVKPRAPTLADLRDSGALEEDADVVIGIHRPFYYDPDDESKRFVAELHPLKLREGASDTMARLAWVADWPGFGRLSTYNLEDL